MFAICSKGKIKMSNQQFNNDFDAPIFDEDPILPTGGPECGTFPIIVLEKKPTLKDQVLETIIISLAMLVFFTMGYVCLVWLGIMK